MQPQGSNRVAAAHTAPDAGGFRFEPLIDSKQAGSLLGIHWKTVQQFARTGQIPAHRIGNLWRFRASELDTWLRSGCVPNGAALISTCQSVRVN